MIWLLFSAFAYIVSGGLFYNAFQRKDIPCAIHGFIWFAFGVYFAIAAIGYFGKFILEAHGIAI